MLVKPTLTDIYEEKCQKLCVPKQEAADCDWIPAAEVTPPSFKRELKMHSQKIFFFANEHLPFAEVAVLHRIR